MKQNLNSKNYINNLCYKQINPLQINYPHPYKKEIPLPRLNTKKSSFPKKTVRFNPNISISEVESWKKYNQDMSKETEYMQLKREILVLKTQKKYYKIEDEDCCTIF